MNRRDFLKLGILTTVTSLAPSCSLNAAEQIPGKQKLGNKSTSPLKQYVVKDFNHLLGGKLKGLSDNQLKAHFALYANYIKSINEVENKLSSFDISIGDKGQYRSLQLSQTFALGGAVLHELYFANLGITDKEPTGNLKKMINRDFGSIQNFVGHLKLAGQAMRGWSIAAVNFRTGKLSVYGLDQHNEMVPNMVYPILALDVYEHAYAIDYGIDRGAYIDTFVANLNWRPAKDRLELAMSMSFGDIVTA